MGIPAESERGENDLVQGVRQTYDWFLVYHEELREA